ncbi:hypothetical protein PEPS_20160 [Persicobacter psychrovividus]|uniref:Secreted protein n=1 Tax=Persicobacter psychrovividus TaxID=387638 RepID=A0ABM7VFK8_9BACT|nr:hypothetical protein PEPS_20160 [Persicobacter psychrovividus]
MIFTLTFFIIFSSATNLNHLDEISNSCPEKSIFITLISRFVFQPKKGARRLLAIFLRVFVIYNSLKKNGVL